MCMNLKPNQHKRIASPPLNFRSPARPNKIGGGGAATMTILFETPFLRYLSMCL